VLAAPRPGRFDFLEAAGNADPFEAESGDPGIANLGLGAAGGGGLAVWAMADEPDPRTAKHATQTRRRSGNIAFK